MKKDYSCRMYRGLLMAVWNYCPTTILPVPEKLLPHTCSKYTGCCFNLSQGETFRFLMLSNTYWPKGQMRESRIPWMCMQSENPVLAYVNLHQNFNKSFSSKVTTLDRHAKTAWNNTKELLHYFILSRGDFFQVDRVFSGKSMRQYVNLHNYSTSLPALSCLF